MLESESMRVTRRIEQEDLLLLSSVQSLCEFLLAVVQTKIT